MTYGIAQRLRGVRHTKKKHPGVAQVKRFATDERVVIPHALRVWVVALQCNRVVGEGDARPDPAWLPFVEEGKYVDLYRSDYHALSREACVLELAMGDEPPAKVLHLDLTATRGATKGCFDVTSQLGSRLSQITCGSRDTQSPYYETVEER